MFYVSMSDPMGEKGFRPSRTKPIPVWMQPFRRRADGALSGQREGVDGLSGTCPQNSTSCEPRGGHIPGVNGPGSAADSDTSLQPPLIIIKPLRVLRSRPVERVAAGVNGPLSSLGAYHTSPESPERPAGKKRPKTTLDVKPEERNKSAETLTGHRKTNSIKHNTIKDHSNGGRDLPQKPSKANQAPAQSSSSFNGPRVSKSATPLESSASRQRHQLIKKPGTSKRPSIPVRRSNHQAEPPVLGLRNDDGMSTLKQNPRVEAGLTGRRVGSAIEPASTAEARRMRSHAAARERTSAKDQTAVHGPMDEVEVRVQRQVKKPRSMQTELRLLFGR